MSATLGAQDTYSLESYGTTVPADQALPTPMRRLVLTATTTVYLVARPTFTVNTLTGYGSLWARRVSREAMQ